MRVGAPEGRALGLVDGIGEQDGSQRRDGHVREVVLGAVIRTQFDPHLSAVPVGIAAPAKTAKMKNTFAVVKSAVSAARKR